MIFATNNFRNHGEAIERTFLGISVAQQNSHDSPRMHMLKKARLTAEVSFWHVKHCANLFSKPLAYRKPRHDSYSPLLFGFNFRYFQKPLRLALRPLFALFLFLKFSCNSPHLFRRDYLALALGRLLFAANAFDPKVTCIACARFANFSGMNALVARLFNLRQLAFNRDKWEWATASRVYQRNANLVRGF